MDVIKLLPDSLANQIAAGEVVQRPASVVKELLENSVDAGASKIQLIIKDAGKSLIQIIDDGIGMSGTDARMCFERHATSKIGRTEDLFNIQTLGFRGEALASIAAVAQVEMKTKRKIEELGCLLCIEGSKVKKQELCSCIDGTSISVKNLFFNVPARRNFLKSNAVEYKHILEEFQRISLANPEIRFELNNDGQQTYTLDSGKLSKRIVQLFGKNYQDQLVSVDEKTPVIEVRGYIGKPENSKKTRGEQFFFINNRFIKSNYLNHAVNTSYDGLLQNGYFPFFVIFITMDPKHIDINVHPTKTEVKFDDERTMYGTLKAAIRQALGTHNIAPSLDFGTDINFNTFPNDSKGFSSENQKSSYDRSYENFKSIERNASNQNHWQQLYDSAFSESTIDTSKEIDGGDDLSSLFSNDKPNESNQTVTFQSAANDLNAPLGIQETTISKSIPFQLHAKYILKQTKSGLLIINQQAAHERVLYEKFKGQLSNKSGASQQLLFPSTINFNPADYAIVLELEQEIKSLGFEFETFGNNTIILRGKPMDVTQQDDKTIFEGLIEQFKLHSAELNLDKNENLVRTFAARSSLKEGQILSSEEMSAIIDQLFACEQPNYDPWGKKVFMLLDTHRIDSFFES